MAQAPKSSPLDPSNSPAQWEDRTAQRVMEGGRDQILERSRRIVAAAYQLLEESGLEGLTIRAVLDKTGLSRRAFYERFEGKDDLVLAVFEQTIRLATSHYSAQVRTLADPMERLRLIVFGIVLGRESLDGDDSTLSHRRGAAMSREHLRLAESRPDDLQLAVRPLITLVAEQLAAGMSAGVVRAGDPQRLATLVYNLVSTTVHTQLLAQESVQADSADRTRLAEDLWEFCRRAVAA